MALRNILSPQNPQVNSQGQPLSGGFVFLYEPGTTTFITSYTGADLVTPHTEPVRLSGSGRADVWITQDCDMVIQDRNGNVIFTQDNANPDALGADAAGGLVVNGSFEIETVPPVPDGWTAVDDAGSSNAVDSTQSTDGANSYRFTSTGTGGGSLTTTAFFPVNGTDDLTVNFDILATVAAVRNIVRIEWYDVSFVSISDSDVYDSTANPLTWTEFQTTTTPPGTARFAKIKLIGIDPSVLLSGITYYDRISVFYPTLANGVFDNITVQDNEIISTNLDGEINLTPNGLGPVNIQSDGTVDLADVQNPLNISVIGPPAANPHIAFDANSVQAKGNATTAAALDLNAQGGQVLVGAQTGAGDVELYLDGVLRFGNNPPGSDIGVFIQGDLNNAPSASGLQDQNIIFQNLSAVQTARLGFLTAGTTAFDVANFVDSGRVVLRGLNASSASRQFVAGDPDAMVQIFHPVANQVTIQTVNPASGGAQVNNTLTGFGLERVATESDIGGGSSTGTFIPTFTGFGTPPANQMRWQKVGGWAWLIQNSSNLATSNATTMTITNLPTAVRPAVGVRADVFVRDNGADLRGVAFISAAGVITFGTGFVGGGFTASGTKGQPAQWFMAWPLNNPA